MKQINRAAMVVGIMAVTIFNLSFAATVSTTLTINGIVQSSCQINVTTPIMTFNFVGNVPIISNQTNLTFQCTAGQNAEILLSSASGVTPSTAFKLRNINNPAHGIAYTISGSTITDAPGSQLQNATNWVLVNGNGGIFNTIPQGTPIIYGRLSQNGGMEETTLSITPNAPVASLPSGTYSDTLLFLLVY